MTWKNEEMEKDWLQRISFHAYRNIGIDGEMQLRIYENPPKNYQSTAMTKGNLDKRITT